MDGGAFPDLTVSALLELSAVSKTFGGVTALQDVDFSLLPGEQVTVRGQYDDRAAAGKEPVLEIEGYNVQPGTVAVGEFVPVKDDTP